MHSLALHRLNPLTRRLVLLTGLLMLLLTRVGDVYAHLCLDGQEPPVSLHFENLSGTGEHADHDGDVRPHNDYEVDVSTGLLLVKFKSDDGSEQTFLPATSVLLSGLWPVGAALPALPASPLIPPPSALLPPFRGPPHTG